MKRKPELEGLDDGRYKSHTQTQKSAMGEAHENTVGRGRRHGAFLRKLRALNKQFSSWIDTQSAATLPLPWIAGAQDYLKYVEELRQEYKDVIDESFASGSLLVWGTGDMGQLGLGDEVSERPRPSPLSLGNLAVRKIACGGMHTIALTTSGEAWSWGVNDEGALGREVTSSNDHVMVSGKPPSASAIPDNMPGKIVFGSGIQISDISAGDSHSAAVDSGGDVYAWGSFRDSSGLWCFSTEEKIQMFPKKLTFKNSTPITQVSCGADHVLVRSAGGKVYSWGCGERGRLGRIPEEGGGCDGRKGGGVNAVNLLTPGEVGGPLAQLHCASVHTGAFSSFAITTDHQVFGWGMNNYGQLGWEVPREKGKAGDGFFAPKLIQALSGKQVTWISSGEHHSLALTKSGQVLSFGRSTYGRLGRTDVDVSSDEPYEVPTIVKGIDGKVSSIATGVSVSAAITDAGQVYVWGYGETCQLGKGADENDEATPILMKSNKNFSGNTAVQISLGAQHAAMIAKE